MTNKNNKKIEVTNGIVGFFDILGYTSFLENNKTIDAAEEVLNIITSAEQDTKKEFTKFLTANKGKIFVDYFNILLEDSEWLIFSDTILLTLPLKDSESQYRDNQWLFFILLSIFLNRRMFNAGLPLRGAIATGEYVIEKNCFAGQPIIDAYKLAQKLDLAACALTEDASKNFLSIDSRDNSEEDPKTKKLTFDDLLQHLVIEYLFPLKKTENQHYNGLNTFGLTSNPISDIRQYILESFWKHKKDIPKEAQGKVNNTEQFFRFLMNANNQFNKKVAASKS